jgi:hypothetical protein
MERWLIEGTEVALEYQTRRTPTSGKYYLFRGEQVIGGYEDRAAGLAAYRRLRHEVWLGWLSSSDPKLRLTAARGLCQHEPETPNQQAIAVLWREGTERDRIAVRTELARLEGARLRAAAAAAEVADSASTAAAPAAVSPSGPR